MQRKTYVIDAENGVGLYFSYCQMESSFRYLSKFDRRILTFDTYQEAKNYIFKQYEDDEEIDLDKFRVNFTIMRDTSGRCYFFVQSKGVLGYGFNERMQMQFQYGQCVSPDAIVEVASKREAEDGARYAFVNEFGNPDYYYSGMLLPGQSVSFEEMIRQNGIKYCCLKMVW